MSDSPAWAMENYRRLEAAARGYVEQSVEQREEQERLAERERVRGTLKARINRSLERQP